MLTTEFDRVTTRRLSTCSTCGLRKPAIRSTCSHARAIWLEGEVIGTVEYKPVEWDAGDWRITTEHDGWWRVDTLLDARHELAESGATLRLV